MKFFRLFFVVFLIFSTNEAVNAQLCHENLSVRRSSTKEKTIGEILVRYDLFEDKKQSFAIDYESDILNKKSKNSCHKISFKFSFYNDGVKLMPPEAVYLRLWSVSNAYKYSRNSDRHLKIIGNDDIIFQSETERSASITIPKQSNSEILSAEMDFAQFEKIARSENISLVLGKTEYKLTIEQIAELRRILVLVDQQPDENDLFGDIENNSKPLQK